jgi:long-chain acyl-CoA synthetase
VGRPDQLHGEEIVAFVSLREGQQIAPDELIAWSRERIGGYKYPRELQIVESVPLTSVGKIDRKALRSRVAPAI